MALLFLLAEVPYEELLEALRRATDEIRMFRWMYVAIWIPMFGALILISILNYLQYRRALEESKREEERSVLLKENVYETLVERGGDIEAYVNLAVEKSLSKKD